MSSEPTLISGIILCDVVIREAGTGKCSYIGSFQNYTLPSFPFAVPPFFVNAFITNISDVQNINVTVRIEDSKTGASLASTAIGVGFSQVPKRSDSFEISMPIAGMAFPSPGTYKAVILVNNEKIGEREIPVRPVNSTQPLQ